MGAFENKFKQYILSTKEVNEAIEKGLLSPEIKQPRLEQNYYGEYEPKTNKGLSYKKSIGIRVTFGKGSITNHCFYLTDFYFIHVEPNTSLKATPRKNDNPKITYTRPDVIQVIPLELVNECEIAYGKTYSWKEEGQTVEKQKNAVAGAVVGAAVAGPVGAVVGSIANSGTKKVTTPTVYHKNSYYNLNIRIGEESYSIDDWKTENDLRPGQKREEVANERARLNQEAKALILRAKKGLSENEKLEIIKETISEAKEEKRGETKKAIFAVIGIIAIIVFYVIITS